MDSKSGAQILSIFIQYGLFLDTAIRGAVGRVETAGQHRMDSKVVAREAVLYAKSLKLAGDGKDVWVFDIDETSLSNLPYYAKHGFGFRDDIDAKISCWTYPSSRSFKRPNKSMQKGDFAKVVSFPANFENQRGRVEPYNATSFDEWVLTGKAPVLPETLKLYQEVLKLGIKPIFLTGRSEDQRKITSSNLRNAGFYKWEMLILKGSDYSGTTAVVYKSNERRKVEESGYRIIGNIGDQWSDVLGTHAGNRTFMLPDPLYYIS